MYRVIFIDDEAITLNLLQSAIDWGKYNVVVCGTASDGAEGIELFRQVEPDIVIADIRMPNMTGIEFSGAIRQSNKKVKILLLSAYADFDYAQIAIKYQVSEYLLKPLDEDKLEKAIERVVQEIDSENSISSSIVTYRMKNAEKQLQQLFIQNRETEVSQANADIPEEVLEAYRNSDRLVDVLSINEAQSLRDYAFIETIKQTFKDQLGTGVGVAVINPIELVALTTGTEFQQKMEEIFDILRQQEKFVKVGISHIVNPIDLLQSCHQAEIALYQAFYTGEVVCNYSNSFRFTNDLTINVADFENHIMELVEQGKCEELISVFQSHLSNLFLKQVYPPLIYDFVIDVLKWIKITTAKQYRDDTLTSFYTIDRNRLRLCATKENMVSYLDSLLKNASQAVQEFIAGNSSYYIVRRAKEYTKEHYTQVEFSLHDVADFVGLSKNYFSKVFHESTGQKFWDYVTQYRIEKAKELLRNSNRSNCEISLSIGYESEFYFSKIFKRVVGISPQQYRKR